MDDTVVLDSVYIDVSGKEYQIYPMKLGECSKVDHLFRKINDTYLFLNLPTPKVDKDNNIILNSKGEPIMDTRSYDAMMKLFEMALKLPLKTVKDIVDLKNGVQILDEYRQISGLKKKIQGMAMEEILRTSSQA